MDTDRFDDRTRSNSLVYGLLALLTLALVVVVFMYMNSFEEPDVGVIEQQEVVQAEEQTAEIPEHKKIDRTIQRAPAKVIKKTPSKVFGKTRLAKSEKKAPKKTVVQELLVHQSGTLVVRLELSKWSLEDIKIVGEKTRVSVRLEPLEGLDPVFHARAGTLDPETFEARFTKLAAVRWRVIICGFQSTEVTIQPNKTRTLICGTFDIQYRHFRVTDSKGKGVSDAEIYWLTSSKRKISTRESFLGKTDTSGEFAAWMPRRRGAFIAKIGKGEPAVFRIGKSREIFGLPMGSLVATVQPKKVGGTVSGRLTLNVSGAPVRNALVQIFPGSDPILTTKKKSELLKNYAKRILIGEQVPYPPRLGLATITDVNGEFHFQGVPTGPSVVVVRHATYAPPRPFRFHVGEGQKELALRCSLGAKVYGRAFRGRGGDSTSRFYAGTTNRSVYRPALAADGSYELIGVKRSSDAVGLWTNPANLSFLELREIFFEDEESRKRVNFNVD